MSNPMWAFEVAEALTERDNIPQAQRFYRQAEYVRRAIDGETVGAPTIPASATPPAARAADPAPAPQGDWGKAVREANAMLHAAASAPSAPAEGAARSGWAKAVANANAALHASGGKMRGD